MNYKFILNLIFLASFLLISFSLTVKKTYAYSDCLFGDVPSGIQHISNIYFCENNSNTYWGVSGTYTDKDGYQLAIDNIYQDSQGGWSGCAGTYGYWTYPSDYIPTTADFIEWHTACVDPKTEITPSTSFYRCGTGGTYFYDTYIDTTCSSSNPNIGNNLVSCDTPDGKSYVSSNSWCPSGPYCMYGGNTWSSQTCPGAFYQQPQITGTAPSSCGYGGTCNYSYCSIINYNGMNYGSCNNTTDTTGARCGAACTASTTWGCVNSQCTQVAGGSFPDSTCGGTCATPPPTPTPVGCSGAPTYSPPENQPATDTANTPCNTNGTSCQAPCSKTCANGCQATCNSVWGCQSTQWYNSGLYYATCPTSCTTNCSAPGMTRTTCSAANACLVP